MKKLALMTLLLAGAVLHYPPVAAQQAAPAEAAHPLTALFEAAGRGEAAPLERAIADPATPADVRTLLRARLAVGRFDAAPAGDAAIVRLAQSPDPALRRAALTIISTAAFAAGDYAAATGSGRDLVAMLRATGDDQADGADRAMRLAALLAGQPRQAVDGAVTAGSAAARVDMVGLPRVDVSINGHGQEAIFDTGANFSVLSADAARQLGVRLLEGTTPIGNSVQSTVPARVGIADRVEIAGTVLRNVAFLVIDDSQLTFPLPIGRYEIDAIIGLPVMRALGRMRVEPSRFSVVPAEAGSGPSNMRASSSSLYVDAAIDGQPVPLFLDTGANRTTLSALYAERNAERVAALPVSEQRSAGAGGMQVQRIATWANAPLELGGRRVGLPSLQIVLPSERRERDSYGTIGASVLRAFASYTLDFNAMRFELGEPTGR
jgi:predicted aspartyl protease